MVSVNNEQELYVIPCSSGYSCLGFDVMLRKHAAVSAWLRSEGLPADDLPAEARGTIRGYKAYKTAMERAAAHHARSGRCCPAELHPQLCGLEGKRVEVKYADGTTSRFWVGKSTGWMPCHLEIKRRNSFGGFAVGGFKSVRVIKNCR